MISFLLSVALAQEPRLPELIRFVPAEYPPEALASGVEAAILLELDVSETGQVLAVRVVQGVSPAFDDAAALAARSFVFSPAQDEAGTAVPARIQYLYRFVATQAPTPVIAGSVLTPDGQPMADLDISAVGPDGAPVYARTDQDGKFTFVGLPDGNYTVVLQAPGFLPLTTPVTVTAGVVADLRLLPELEQRNVVSMDVEVVGERISADVTSHQLSQEEIQYLPGTNGDVVRVVQNLPGVARPPLGIGQLIIRGTAPEDSVAFLDGSRIPIVFHFSGLTTVVNGDLLDEVVFMPGNPSVRYGRLLGGLVDLKSKRDLPDESNGYLAVDVYQATLFGEQSFGENNAVTFSARRSYIDAVLSPLLSQGDTQVRAPRYYDGQLRFQHLDQQGGQWEGLVVASVDAFRVLGEDNNAQIGLSTEFFRGRVRYLGDVGPWEHELVLSTGTDYQGFVFDVTGEAWERNCPISLRDEWTLPVSADRAIGLRLGVDADGGWEGFLYDVPAFGPKEAADAYYVAPAAYAELTARLGTLKLIPGVRADGLWLENGELYGAVDPRLAMRLGIGQSTALKGATGLYSQPPGLRQLLPEADGNPDLGFAHSIQNSLGVEQSFGSQFSFDAGLFYNYLYDLVVGREDRIRFFSGPPPVGPLDTDPYANDGVGWIYGAELLGRYTTDRTLAQLAVTLSRSERRERPDDPVSLFEYDQPIVINALASQELGKNWRVGSRVRYGSGNPYTPVVNRIYALDSRSFIPVYGERDSARLPPFFSLDLRVDKEWEFEKWGLGIYLDIQNATYAKNVEVMGWSYDYSEAEPVEAIPPVPSFGLKGKW